MSCESSLGDYGIAAYRVDSDKQFLHQWDLVSKMPTSIKSITVHLYDVLSDSLLSPQQIP